MLFLHIEYIGTHIATHQTHRHGLIYTDMYVLIKLAQRGELVVQKILIWFMCITITGRNNTRLKYVA